MARTPDRPFPVSERTGGPTARQDQLPLRERSAAAADERRRETGVDLSVYRCDFCSAWHLGNPGGRRTGERGGRVGGAGGGARPDVAPSVGSTGTNPTTRSDRPMRPTMSPCSVGCSHDRSGRRPSSRDFGQRAATSGIPSTSCASAPNGCGRSAPILRSGSRVGTRTSWPRSGLRPTLTDRGAHRPDLSRARLAGGRVWRRPRRPHPLIQRREICAFEIVQRNAHEVCHHLWDVQRGIA